MATNKQRIQAYIDLQLFEAFEVERVERNISQSQALERILAERYDTKIVGFTVDNSALSDRITRLETEIKGMVALNNGRFEQIYNRFDWLEGAIGQLFHELSEKENKELASELLRLNNSGSGDSTKID